MIIIILYICSFIYAQENRIKIAIIDTGIPTQKEFAPYLCKDNITTIQDTHGHATVIAHIFKDEGLDYNKYCLLFRGVQLKNNYFVESFLLNELKKLLFYNIKYLNLSYSGKSVFIEEKKILGVLLQKKVKIYIAAGNTNQNLNLYCNIFPGCYYNNLLNWNVVGALNNNNDKLYESNYGSFLRYENGIKCINNECHYGTSYATPRAILRDIKYENSKK